jgi:hypothetical protein
MQSRPGSWLSPLPQKTKMRVIAIFEFRYAAGTDGDFRDGERQMLKLRHVAIALTLLVALAPDSWGQSRQPPGKTSPQNAAQQERGTENSPVVVKVVPTEKTADELAREDARVQERLAIDQRFISLTGDLALSIKLLFVAAGVLSLITLGLVVASFRQVGDARKSIAAALDSAAAARGSAEAFMNAEGAQLYPVVTASNLEQIFRLKSGVHEPAMEPSVRMQSPSVSYCFKNYGKTPAKLQSIMHNIQFFDPPSQYREMQIEQGRPLEIIGAGEASSDIACEMPAPFNENMVRSVAEHRGELLFYGEAVFTDFFDRQFLCFWEYDGRDGRFRLTSHEQRLDPDRKSKARLPQPTRSL